MRCNELDRVIRKECPVCGSEDTFSVTQKRGTVLSEFFTINRCKKCTCVFVVDPIDPKHLDEIYNTEYFSGDGMDDSVNYVENIDRQNYFFEKYDYQIGSELEQYDLKPGLKWLDLGCALGNVLDWASDRYSARTYGIELSEFARKKAQSRGHQIIGATIEDVTKEYRGFFDIITCYEVLEHLYEPNKIIESVEYMLKDGGVFHYSTGAPPKNHRINKWQYLRPEVHITFYSPKCIAELFTRNNLTPVPRQYIPVNRKFQYYKPSWKGKIKLHLPGFLVRVLRQMQPDAVKGKKF